VLNQDGVALALVGLAIAFGLVAIWILRRLGPAYRIGRLLAASPRASIAEAITLARSGRPAYVRTTGRISSDEVFPDEHDRPLVFRRTRLMAAAGGGWQVLSDDIEAVPFGLEARSDFIAIDEMGLAEGLVVIPREAEGRVGDLPAEAAAGLPPDSPAKLVIDQISAVEQAIACGVPALDAHGRPRLSAGLGRPLILTTLESGAAMRILVAGRRGLVAAAAVLLALAAISLVLAAGLLLASHLAPAAALAADPTPVLIDPLDPRAGGQASRVGDAVAAIIAVIGVGAVAAVITYTYTRIGRG
jgi:hypothetical protein